MTDEQIDAVIERVKPELRVAVRALLNGEAVHIFDLFDGKNSRTGVSSKIVLFMAQEAPAAVLEGAVNGLNECGRIYQRMMAAAARH